MSRKSPGSQQKLRASSVQVETGLIAEPRGSSTSQIVGALLRAEFIEQFGNAFAGVAKRAFGGLTEQVLKFGEHPLESD